MDERAGIELDVAVVGLAGRFPGAGDVERFWENLASGRESIVRTPAEELRRLGFDPAELEHERFVNAKGALEGIAEFDADFFGMTPLEAAITDPQHRLFLECAWEALEDAGHGACAGEEIGVFAACLDSGYVWRNVLADPDVREAVTPLQLRMGGGADFLAARTAYKLDLRGPTLTVAAACSSSLTAVHLACQSLLLGECSAALAGAAAIGLPELGGYRYEEGGIVSPDGHCRAFDADAQGTVPGDGVAVVVLKRLADAVRDGDAIRAVIKGSAVNNDGRRKPGFAAPSVDGLRDAVLHALDAAGVDARTVGYVEMHGTGTVLGDAVEASALHEAYGNGRREPLLIGSVKTNVGHLDVCAGMAGLVKAVLALERELIPPTIHYRRPNPELERTNGSVAVAAEPTAWPRGGEPRRAAVSSFGIGGTNVHVLLEEGPPRRAPSPGRRWQVLTLSAATETALVEADRRLRDHLTRHSGLDLADVAYTLHVGRRAFPDRAYRVVSSVADALAGEPARAPAAGLGFVLPPEALSGGAAVRELYDREPAFRDLGSDPERALAEAIGALWAHGAAIDWAAYHRGESRARVPLPTYPFERRTHWAGGVPGGLAAAALARDAPSLEGTDLEGMVRTVWSQALGRDDLGPDDDFFVLGGDSVAAFGVVSRIRDALGLDVPIESIFDAPTISSFVHEIENRILVALGDADAVRGGDR